MLWKLICLTIMGLRGRSGILLVAGLILTAPCAGQEWSAEGTREMARLLQEIASEVDPMKNPFLNAERAELLEKRAATNNADLATRFSLGTELLNAGRNLEALRLFEQVEKTLVGGNPVLLQQNLANLKVNQALCWLRMGELTNCVADHNADSCLAPIAGRGVHRFQEGSRKAITILTDLLQQRPDNLMARWLLNIAAMTVADYPEKVPTQWVIPPNAFASDYDIKRFTNVASRVGLDPMELSGGSIVEDFDGDGDLDVMCSSIGFRDQMRYYRNNGDGTFTERTKEAGLSGLTGGLNMLQVDYNNDGHIDVIVLRGAWMRTEGRFPKSLLKNNGNGTFADVTKSAGLLSLQPSQTAVWFDFDSDGDLDLYFGNESFQDKNRCELFRNNGNGTFTECAAESGAGYSGYVKAVVTADYNRDGRPDLYLSVLGKSNVLLKNEGPVTNSTGSVSWKFADVTRQAGVGLPVHSFPCWFFDYDNDGWEDLFVAGYRIKDVGDVCADYLKIRHDGERSRLYRNRGDGSFQDVTVQSGLWKVLLGMGSNYGDLDNDGYLDFYIGTGDPDLGTIIPNRMFRNDGGSKFQDVTTSGGFGHLQKGHGVSFADIDNDGDQDIHEDMGGAYTSDLAHNALYENPGHGNHWLTLKLEGVQSNRSALGAKIKVRLRTEQGDRAIYKTVSPGGSFGASPLRQEIGLGQALKIEAVEIFWPRTGQTQTLTEIEMDRAYHVREGQPKVTPLELKPFRLGAGATTKDHHHDHKH